jgi:hypothetical protein
MKCFAMLKILSKGLLAEKVLFFDLSLSLEFIRAAITTLARRQNRSSECQEKHRN